MSHHIGAISEIPPGEGRAFIVGNTEIAVFHTREGGVFATQAHCPHRNGPLADGLTDGTTIICPLHDRAYSLRSGEGIGNDCAIAVYKSSLIDNQIHVDLESVAGAMAQLPSA